MADQQLGNLVWKITGDSTDFDKKLGSTSKKLAAFGKKANKIGKSLTKFVTLPLVGLGVAAVKLASDVNESINAVNVVFEDAADTIQDFGKTASTAAGLSRTEFNELATVIGAQLKQSGQDINDVADNTVNLTQRAADLASVFNTSVKDAAGALGAALRGESEPARRFGITISDAAVQAEALATGLVKSKSEITDQIKVQARYSLILKQSNDVAGDFANTSDGVANSTRILLAEVKDVGAELGQILLPIVRDVISGLRDAVKWFGDLDEETKKTIITIAGIAAIAGPAILAIGKISTALSFLAANPVVAVIAGITALSIGIAALISAKDKERVEEYAEEINDIAVAAGVAEEAVFALARELDDIATLSGVALFSNLEGVAKEVERIAAAYGITRTEAADLIKLNDDLEDNVKFILDLYEDQFAALDRASAGRQKAFAAATAYQAELIRLEEEARQQAEAREEAEEAAAAAILEQNRLLRAQVLEGRADAYQAYLKTLRDINTALKFNVITEKEALSQRLQAQESYVQSLIDSDLTRESDYGNHLEKLFALRKEWDDLNKQADDEILSNTDEFYQSLLNKGSEYTEAQRLAEEQRLNNTLNRIAAEDAAAEQATVDEQARIQSTLSITQSLYGNLATITGAYFDYKKSLAEGDEAEQKRIATEQFNVNKVLQLANIGINTAAAIVGFLANPGGPAGVGLSIAAGVTGAVQAALIAATPAPSFANGVENFTVPPGYPNDSFPIMVQSGETVDVKTPAQQSASNNQPVKQEFYFNQEMFFSVMNYGLRSGKVQVPQRALV